MKNILLIEDSIQMQKYISDFLMQQDYNISILEDYDNILELVRKNNPNLILLDINLPKYDGFFYLKLLKKNFREIPIIIISARSDESEQIRGIENGATDYITKPFSANILLAKINSLFKRQDENINHQNSGSYIKVNDLIVDNKVFCAKYKDRNIDLTKNEFKILTILLDNRNEIVSRSVILEQLWDDINFVDDNTLTVNISRLKKKLQDIGLSDVIINKRGVGYIFTYG